MHCKSCLDGDHQLCQDNKQTIFGHHGGFANRIKTSWLWAIPLPEKMDIADAGPLLCAGITVFSPMLEFGLKPTDRVAVFDIGGLGHLSVQFANAWGCEVAAFSSTASKLDEEIKAMGADHIVSSRDTSEWTALISKFDLIVITVAAGILIDEILVLIYQPILMPVYL
jgi:alcohol/geraniol dehydrogenase (NADP+)